MKDILKEGIWDNIITGVKKAQKTAGANLGNATSSGELALIKTTEMLHRGFETWCGANNKKVTDSDALFDYLTDDNVVGFSDEFAHNWANKYDEFMRDPNAFLKTNQTGGNAMPPNTPATPANTSQNQNSPINQSQSTPSTSPATTNSNQPLSQNTQDQIDYTEQIYGPLLQNHLASVVYKQYAAGHKPSSFTNKQDGLFIFVTKANLAIMKSIRDEIRAGTISKKEKYNEYVKRGVMRSWKDIASAIRVKPTEDNAKLAIANSMKTGIPRNYFKDIHRFTMASIKDNTIPFIITESESIEKDSKKILIVEDLSSKLRQFFKLIAADGNKSGATRQAVHNSRSRNGQTGSQTTGNNSNSSRNTGNVPTNTAPAGPSYASATPEVSFSRQEIDYIKSAEQNINGGLVGLSNVTQTANIQHKKEISNIIKKIVAAGLANLKKNHPNILS